MDAMLTTLDLEMTTDMRDHLGEALWSCIEQLREHRAEGAPTDAETSGEAALHRWLMTVARRP
jgi:hypothetical protein